MVTITGAEGITIQTNTLKISMDTRSKFGDVHALSHTHSDHLFCRKRAPVPVITSSINAELLKMKGKSAETTDFLEENGLKITISNAGHVPGSVAITIYEEDTGESIIYTGDVTPQKRPFVGSYTPKHCNTLIIESTYGLPDDVHQSASEVLAEIKAIVNTNEKPCFFSFPLGKPQILTRMAIDNKWKLYVHPSIKAISDAVSLKPVYTPIRDADLIILPPSLRADDPHFEFFHRATVPFIHLTGGMARSSRSNGMKHLQLSDHADFNDLLSIVEKSTPERVFVHHGKKERLAKEIKERLGIPAFPVSRTQRQVQDFFS